VESDYDWYVNADLSEFAGRWVAIVNKQVIASNPDPRKLVEEIQGKHPGTKPLLAKVSEEVMIL
jgi:Family of unknown function (DUF5678)